MVWNLYFQFAALIVATVVAAMCIRQKRLDFSAEKAYTKLLYFVIVSIVLDILSEMALNYRDVLDISLVDIVCKLYLLSISLVACLASWFAVKEIQYANKKHWINLSALPLLIHLLLIIFLPIDIRVDEKGLYTGGIPVYFTYFACIMYFLATAALIRKLKDAINVKRRSAIQFLMGAWILAAVIQIFNSRIFLISFAMSLGCMYMYCKLENPDYLLDFATNVFNKKGFETIMTELIKKKAQNSLISIRINDINRITEVFGSNACEKLILDIVRFLEKIPHSRIFRIEDDLFCVVLDNFEESEKALENIQKRFSYEWKNEAINIEVRGSFSFVDDISKFSTIDELEDVVHYFSLESLSLLPGEVLFVNDKELSKRQKASALHNAIEWALRNDKIEVYYQPIYNIKEGKFSSLEALIRIWNEKGLLLNPQEAIEYAEKNGMILKLGEVVFTKTCEFIQRMHIEEYGIEYVEINLSGVQCVQEDMSRLLKNIMGEYQIPPYRVNFEITETAEIASRRIIDKNMRELLDYGCSFSLDDYGSGYSNLTYVINLPIKIIKIDKLITDGYLESDKVRIVAEYSIEMAHKLGLEVVVEGVDSEEKYLAFKKLGVEYIQGFYFSKPLPKEKVLPFIQEWL